jgi:maleate isomerase
MNSERMVRVLSEFDSVVQELREAVAASRTTLRLDTPGKDFPVVAEARAEGVPSIAAEVSISQRGAATAQRLFETRKPLIQSDCANADPPPPKELLSVYGVQAQMLGPIVRDEDVVGWLSVHYMPSPREWGEDDVAALEQAVGRVEAELDKRENRD